MGYDWRAAARDRCHSKRELEQAHGHINTRNQRGTRPAGWDMNGGGGTQKMPQPSQPSASPSTRAATPTCPAREASGVGHERRRRHTIDAAAITAERELQRTRGHINTLSTRGARPAGWDVNRGSGTREVPQPSQPSASHGARTATSTRQHARHVANGTGLDRRRRHARNAAAITAGREPEHARPHKTRPARKARAHRGGT